MPKAAGGLLEVGLLTAAILIRLFQIGKLGLHYWSSMLSVLKGFVWNPAEGKAGLVSTALKGRGGLGNNAALLWCT